VGISELIKVRKTDITLSFVHYTMSLQFQILIISQFQFKGKNVTTVSVFLMISLLLQKKCCIWATEAATRIVFWRHT